MKNIKFLLITSLSFISFAINLKGSEELPKATMPKIPSDQEHINWVKEAASLREESFFDDSQAREIIDIANQCSRLYSSDEKYFLLLDVTTKFIELKKLAAKEAERDAARKSKRFSPIKPKFEKGHRK